MRAALVSLLLLLSLTAHAEINAADSVEWMACDAELIVRGRVIAVKPGKDRWLDVDVRVDEVLLGKAGPVVTVRLVQTMDWVDERADAVLFLVPGRRRAAEYKELGAAPWVLRHGSAGGEVLCLGCKRVGHAYDLAFNVISKPADLVAAVRAAVAGRGATQAYRIDLPGGTPAYQDLWGGSSVWFFVPVDGRLAVWAQQQLRSTDVSTRVQAAGALAFFRSPATIQLLEGLLADPGVYQVSDGTHTWQEWPVRKVAYDTLVGWGLRVKKPVLRR